MGHLVQRDAGSQVKCSFFQIYNEQVLDLLNPTGTEEGLTVRQSVDKGVYVENLRQLDCKALAEVPNPNPNSNCNARLSQRCCLVLSLRMPLCAVTVATL